MSERRDYFITIFNEDAVLNSLECFPHYNWPLQERNAMDMIRHHYMTHEKLYLPKLSSIYAASRGMNEKCVFCSGIAS